MAWTAPRTWVAAETLTAALLNTHVRDNLLETATAKVTTKGDLTVATAANSITRLAVGSDYAPLVAYAAATSGLQYASGTFTAAAGTARCLSLTPTMTAAANSDLHQLMLIQPTIAKGAFTGQTLQMLVLNGSSISTSGAGTVTNAYGLYITPPTLGTMSNWALYITAGNSQLGGTSSKVFIGDDSNANMTAGLTINGTAESERVALKDSANVAHGITTQTETDTFATIYKVNLSGGLKLEGYIGNFSGLARPGVEIIGTSYTADTARSTSAHAAIEVSGRLASGTGVASLGANSNIITFEDNGTVRFIFDTDGDSHEDGTGWTAYDDFDDVALLQALDYSLDKKLNAQAGAWLRENKAALQAARIVTFNDDTDGIPFINKSRLGMLLVGAVRQMAARVDELEGRLLALSA